MSLARWWHKITGHRFDGPEGQDTEAVRRLGVNFGKKVVDIGPEVVHRVAAAAVNHGVKGEDLPYVFWVLAEGEAQWPGIGRSPTRALKLARDLMLRSGKTPPYRRALGGDDHYSELLDHLTDRALVEVADWADVGMVAMLGETFMAALARHKSFMVRAVAGREVPANKALTYLYQLFKLAMRNNSRDHVNGDLMARVLPLI